MSEFCAGREEERETQRSESQMLASGRQLLFPSLLSEPSHVGKYEGSKSRGRDKDATRQHGRSMARKFCAAQRAVGRWTGGRICRIWPVEAVDSTHVTEAWRSDTANNTRFKKHITKKHVTSPEVTGQQVDSLQYPAVLVNSSNRRSSRPSCPSSSRQCPWLSGTAGMATERHLQAST